MGMTLWFVLGTAAELIKVVPLIRGAAARGWEWKVVSTGQSPGNFWRQYDDFKLPRAQAVSALASGSDLATSTQAMVWFLRALLKSPRSFLISGAGPGPNWIVVHGDTLSTLVGAWWGRRLGWRVAHVEAGLRSKSILQPFPEEICRRLVSRLANVHFGPDEKAIGNLKRAGVNGVLVDTKGNSLLDAVRSEGVTAPVWNGGPLCVANLHRYENLNSPERWRIMVETLVKASRRHQVVMVMHPQTEHKINSDVVAKRRLSEAGVEFRPRMMFAEFLALVKVSEYLISDGGSNQEECYYLGKPCLILRDTTERQEGLGANGVLSHFDPSVIESFLSDPLKHKRPEHSQGISPTAIMLDALAEGRA